MTEQESRVLAAVKQSPLASQQALADSLHMSRESVAGHIMRLTRQGHILGKGYLVPKEDSLLVIGGCNLDINGTPQNPMRLADSNPGQIHQSAGGVGRNIAENMVRLGNRIHFISIVGQDSSGDWLLEQTRQAGINTQDIIRHPSFSTSSYLSINDQQGQLVAAIADMDIIDALDANLLSSKLALLQSARRILIEANLSAQSIEWLASQPLKAEFYADAVSATKAIRLRPILNRLSLLKVNRDEAKAILDWNSQPAATDEDLAAGLLALGVNKVLLSLASDGIMLADHSGCHSSAVFRTQVSSDTGAGDALFAGFVHAHANDWPLQSQLDFCLGCAGMTLESPHANHPTLSETAVLNWIQTR